eukprot:CAMPEP_0115025234 /NCGR_PEP_ID=MMETSP0216-20121206/33846_1 /TAXON_ID=223996 /ORGANISM="Protocruzia adherens, Strain Boccale" /LENGTH=269 /DNA_ID=CAMNT_0002399713 /DNA_START=66 /DNA_END=875 /DNA_ORIENTATION=+
MSYLDTAKGEAKRIKTPLLKQVSSDNIEQDIAQNLKTITRNNNALENSLGDYSKLKQSAQLAKSQVDLLATTKKDLLLFEQTSEQTSKVNRFKKHFNEQNQRYSRLGKQLLDSEKESLIRAKRDSISGDHHRPDTEDTSSINHNGYDDDEAQRQQEIQINANLKKEAVYYEEIIQDRQKEIEDLESCIFEVRDLLVDSAKEVQIQGEVLDRIDDHLESSKVKTKQAHQELVKADNYMKKGNRRTCVFCMILVVVAVTAVLIILGAMKKL